MACYKARLHDWEFLARCSASGGIRAAQKRLDHLVPGPDRPAMNRERLKGGRMTNRKGVTLQETRIVRKTLRRDKSRGITVNLSGSLPPSYTVIARVAGHEPKVFECTPARMCRDQAVLERLTADAGALLLRQLMDTSGLSSGRSGGERLLLSEAHC